MAQNVNQEYFEEIRDPSTFRCIYRVPQYLRKVNEEAYTPCLISIGPLHYGRKELMMMENQKRRYWSKFFQRLEARKLCEFKTYIENHEELIRAHYSVTSMLESSKYVTMILYDAVFIIELLLRSYDNDIDITDFLLRSPLDVSIKRDLLLLENQLPYFVLHGLYTDAFPTNMVPISALFLKYFFGSDRYVCLPEQFLPVKHINEFYRLIIVKGIDFHRLIIVEGETPRVESTEVEINDLPCATKLDTSGLKFKCIEHKSWLDISWKKRQQYGKWFPWFEVSEVNIPTIKINDNTECLLRNLMAFEMFHCPTETRICHYAALMDRLIDNDKDVDLLVEKGIIVNLMGHNEVIAKMFNRLVSHMAFNNQYSRYNDTAKEMKAHYRHPWNRTKATLKSVYFSNIWTGTGTVVATLLLILTLIQSVCSVMQII